MEYKTKYEVLCSKGQLYSEEFIDKMGRESSHWDSNNWFQRESSLRHDMVCLLLCNTEPYEFLGVDRIDEALGPPEKRKKFEENMSALDSASSSSSSNKTLIKLDDIIDFGGDNSYRYILLEGRSNVIQVQNKICELYNIPILKRQYDIFDRKERKFCEVKVTVNMERSMIEYESYLDPPEHTSFFHINPDTMEYKYLNKGDDYPGIGKAISFLIKRKTLMATLDVHESEFDPTGDMVSEIFKCERFNQSKSQWIETFWKLRNLELLPIDSDPNIPLQVSQISERKLKELIEDTTLRNSEYMKFKAKLLPDQYTSYLLTKSETDGEMMDDIFQNRNFIDSDLNWVVETWNSKKDTFNLVDGKDLRKVPSRVLEDLGIDMKNSVRVDNHPDLIQPNFSEPPKLKYANWLSNLIKDFSDIDDEGLQFFPELSETEFRATHPIARASQDIVDKIFKEFSYTSLASYCSKVKNFYSRMGGAYLRKGGMSDKRPAIVIFPLYSSGHKNEESIRKITGFIIRGPQHAKKSTDRIPFISIEILGNGERSLKYQKFMRSTRIIVDNLGTNWCYKVNSIQKNDPAYLTFVIDSTYLTTNMIGEMTFSNINLNRNNIVDVAFSIIENCREWIIERMAESVLMAVMGNSQEEGLLSGLRKVFMLKLNWHRGERAWGSDIAGFADSINECLLDQPLALYFAKQARDFLDG